MRQRLSLKNKIGIMVVVMALVLTAVSGIVSYHIYSETMDRHYKSLAMNIAQTAADMVDAKLVSRYANEVMEIYQKDPMSEWTDEQEEEAYFQQYFSIQDDDHPKLLETLDKIREANQADSLYIVYMDPVSMSCVYIADPDQTENACPMGTWDIIYEQNYEAMTHPEDGFPAYITNSEYGWLCSAGAAILNEDGTVAAHAMVDLSMDEIMADRHNFLFLLCCVLAVITLILLYVLTRAANCMLVAPINRLMVAAESYVNDRQLRERGESEGETAIEKMDIRTGDELEALSLSMKQMERDISSYIENLAWVTAEKERIGAELQVATQIQASMLPRIFPPFPERKDINIYATMDPAREVGGDFYDFFLIDQTHLGMVVADVSGKGVPAALFMVIAKTLIKDHACSDPDPAAVFTWVNQQLCESNEAGLFVTAWMGILNLHTGQVEYVNAGHNPPVLTGQDGEFHYLKQKSGLVLAGMEEFIYQKATFQLKQGDRLFLYTDGVTEAMNQKDELYGEGRLLTWLNSHRDLSISETLHGLRQDIEKFSDGVEQSDDITMLIFEMAGM